MSLTQDRQGEDLDLSASVCGSPHISASLMLWVVMPWGQISTWDCGIPAKNLLGAMDAA